jgi:hypothetical protein
MSAIRNHKIKIIVILLFTLLFVLLGEAIYVYTHRDVYSMYLLKTAKMFAAKGKADPATYFFTQGDFKIDNSFENKFLDYLNNLPEKTDLPKAAYDLALISYQEKNTELTPKFFKLASKWDPDFSFWRVELANYYLLDGAKNMASQVLEDCIALPAPSAHCNDYKNLQLNTNKIQNPGFLKEDVINFYQTKNFEGMKQ